MMRAQRHQGRFAQARGREPRPSRRACCRNRRIKVAPLTTVPNPLSTRECEVLALMLKGYSPAECAAELDIQKGTVVSHLSDARHKLRVASNDEAVATAQAIGALTRRGARRSRISRSALDALQVRHLLNLRHPKSAYSGSCEAHAIHGGSRGALISARRPSRTIVVLSHALLACGVGSPLSRMRRSWA
jgi:DNA-binding CsgD family transcriptional regulator